MSEMDRISMLMEFLGTNPSDCFARYALAMEYAKTGQIENALVEFNRIVEINPDYTAAYQMAGQTLMKTGRMEEARKLLQQGIGSATRTGNRHAQSEMEGLLGELE